MPSLLSGSKLRTGGSGQFLKLADAMPQLPQSPTTSTGYTVVTNDKLVTTYATSLGNIEFFGGQVYSNINTQTLTLIGTGTTSVVIASTTPSSNTGTLEVHGGAGIFGDLLVNGYIEATTSTFLTLKVLGTDTSTTPFTGALQVLGGAGIGENLNVYGNLSVLTTGSFSRDVHINQNLSVTLDTNITGELNVTGAGSVALSPAAANVNIQPTLGGSILIQPSLTGHIENMVIGLTDAQDGYFQTVHANNITATNTVWVGGSVYSQDGIAEENNLLYTPRSTLSIGIPPSNPRLGDFWIDPSQGATFQYLLDGVNKVWVQFTGL